MIYLDTCLAIYLAERHPRFGARVADAVRKASGSRFAVSPLVKLECMVGPVKRADPILQATYADLFEVFETLTMPETVYLQAAHLRARFGLKTPDALHLACAQHHRCEAMWTNDDRLAQPSHGLAIRILK